MTTAGIDRHALVDRHRLVLTEPNAQHALSVGNGDFAYTADVTGMQSFIDFHTARRTADGVHDAVNTSTMSNWGWHEMPNPKSFVLDDAMSTYDTARGPVSYPDRHDMMGAMTGHVAEEFEAGAWLHANPQRVDLGRVGLELRSGSEGDAETDPSVLGDVEQSLDLWDGVIDSSFSYQGEPVRVQTVSSPDRAVVAFRIESPMLVDGRVRVAFRFPYPSDGFQQTADWNAVDAHRSDLDANASVIARHVDDFHYRVVVDSSSGELARVAEHAFTLKDVTTDALELVVAFDEDTETEPLPTFDQVAASAQDMWSDFWQSGAAVDFSGSSDSRAHELERRVVLSQYLSRVLGAGSLPPAETGLVTNSWQGKFHLEMHYWHSAHWAAWGRPDLLERSLRWYVKILDTARATAARQGYPGARWPKHTAPDGRESPSDIGSLLVWQQPHLIHMLELVWNASSEQQRVELIERYGEAVEETATFMAAFPEERDGAFHLGPPVMPAQEFYDARTTTDPTFELAYWYWALDRAQEWRVRRGLERRADWHAVQERIASPAIREGRYIAVHSSEPLRRDDHPSFLMSFGVVPPTPLIDPAVMARTLDDVWSNWEWHTAWGWDFPVMSMTASRLGNPVLAVEALLRDEPKNQYTKVGHNPQTPVILPLYLPGNGGTLLAVALIAASGGFDIDGWTVRAEGFRLFPVGDPFDVTRVPVDIPVAVPEPEEHSPAGSLDDDESIGTWLEHPVGGSLLRALLDDSGTNAEALAPVSSLPLKQLALLSQGMISQDGIDGIVRSLREQAGASS